MIPLELKNKATELRKNGSSYNFISRETGISKSMLSYWFSEKSWSKNIEKKNRLNNTEVSTKRILIINEVRKKKYLETKNNIELKATVEFEKLKHNPLFVAGLMLYSGEGDKSIKTGKLRMGNIDRYVLIIFIRFLMVFCGVKKEKIKFWMLGYNDQNIVESEKWWAKSLEIERELFYKTQIIQGKYKTKRLLYGVGNITLTSVELKIKVLKWIDLMSKELSRA
jgi:predicted transcriptional regulator